MMEMHTGNQSHTKWYEEIRVTHVLRGSMDMVVRRGEAIDISGARKGRGRPMNTLLETINKDFSTLSLTEHMTFYRSHWQQKIYVADPK